MAEGRSYKLGVDIEVGADLNNATDQLKQMVDLKEKLKGKLVDIPEEDVKKIMELAAAVDKITAAIKAKKLEVSQLAKTEQEVDKNAAKLEQARSAEAVQLNQIKVQLAEKNKQNKLDARIALSSKNSYDALSATLLKNKNQVKNLLASNKQLTAADKKLIKETQELDKKLKGIDKSLGDNQRNVGNYSSALEGLPGPLGGVAAGLKTATAAARAFIATPLGLILAAISTAVFAVKAAFENSEEGQNKWNKIMAVSGALIGNVVDLLADFGELIISAFENPQQAVEDLWETIKQNLINRVTAIPDIFTSAFDLAAASFSAFGSKIKSLAADIPIIGDGIDKEQAEKDFEEALGNMASAAKDHANAIIQANTGIENSIDKVTEGTKKFIEEQKREGALAAQVADMRAKADKIERKLIEDRANLESKIADLKLKARQEEEFSAKERKEFLIEAQKLEENLLVQEKQALKLKAEAITLENTFARSNKQNLDDAAKARAAVANIETKRLQEAKATQREVNRLNREIIRDEEKLNKLIVEARLKSLNDERGLAIAAQQAEFEAKINSIKGDGEKENQLREQLQINFNQKKEEINKEFDRKEQKERERAVKNNTQRQIIELENQLTQLGEKEVEKRKEINDEILRLQITSLQQEKETILNNTEITEDERFLRIAETERKILQLKGKAAEDATKKEDEEEKKRKELRQSGFDSFVSVTNMAIDHARAKEQQETEIKMRAADERHSNRLQSLQDRLDAELITEDQFNTKKEALDKELADERKRLQIQSAKEQQKLATYSAIINGAQAVVQALGAAPPPFNFILAAATAAAVAAQVSLIQSQPLPAFKEGTESVPGVDRGKDSVLAMLRPKEAVIPTEQNKKYPGLARAFIDGKVDEWMSLYRNSQVTGSFSRSGLGENVSNSLKLQAELSDFNIVRRLKKQEKLTIESNMYLQKMAKNGSSRRFYA